MYISCSYMCNHVEEIRRENMFLSDNIVSFFTQRNTKAAKVAGHCGPEMHS